MPDSRLRAPFPWFGGKSRASELIWERFGDTANYVEAFAGSLAVLLGRPTPPRIETVNDIDCYLSNFWRAVKWAPDQVARWADWPVNEADLHARHRWLVNQVKFRHLMKHKPKFYNAKIAGWWVWGICQWIGGGWCAAANWGEGAPRTHGGQSTAEVEQRPHVGHAGIGVHSRGAQRATEDDRPELYASKGVHRRTLAAVEHEQRADLRSGKGVHRRGPDLADHQKRPDLHSAKGVVALGVTTEWEGRANASRAPKGLNAVHVGNEKRPNLWRGGMGVHRTTPEKLPNLHAGTGYGTGLNNEKRQRDLTNSADWEKRPTLQKGGLGVHREPHRQNIAEQLPSISGSRSASGRGVHASGLLHQKMPKSDRGTDSRLQTVAIYDWMFALAERLRRVRVCCGDWKRVLGRSSTEKIGITAVMLDPPYGAAAGRDPSLYSHDDLEVAVEVRKWAIENGDNPKLRIALCGYEGEHEMPDTWECVAWKAAGGYASSAGNNENADRERVWFSPHCLKPVRAQGDLFDLLVGS